MGQTSFTTFTRFSKETSGFTHSGEFRVSDSRISNFNVNFSCNGGGCNGNAYLENGVLTYNAYSVNDFDALSQAKAEVEAILAECRDYAGV